MLLYNEKYLESLSLNTQRFPYWDRLNNKTILITGATGLICSYLVDLIMYQSQNSGIEVRVLITGRDELSALSRFEKWFFCGNFQFFKQDMKDSLRIDEPADYIIHGAGNAYPALYDKDPVGTMKANMYGTDGLLEYAVRSNAENFLYLSSGEVYGERDIEEGVKENFCGKVDYTNSRSCYPVSKMAAETLCAAYGKQYGLYTNVARLCHVYGATMTAGDNRVINQFMRNVLNGQDIEMKGSGSKIRSYCYVADAVIGILYILLLGERGQAYNIAYDKSIVSIREIAETIAMLGDKKVIRKYTEEPGGTSIEKSVLDESKLKSIGWNGEYDIKMGLEECFSILRK